MMGSSSSRKLLLSLFSLLAGTGPVLALRDNCPTALQPLLPVEERAVSADWYSKLTSFFPERKSMFDADHPLGPGALADTINPSFEFLQTGYINITFFHEGAGYRNQVGLYNFNTQTETMIFPDLSFYAPGCMESGDTVTAGPFTAGTKVGLFLRANGYNGGSNTYFTDKSRNPDGWQHHVTIYDPELKNFLIGIEDLYNLCDRDFNDALLIATILSAPTDGEQADPPIVNTTGMITAPACKSKTDAELAALSSVTETGTEFAILDGTALGQTQIGGQVSEWMVPATGNWAVAKDTRDVRAEIPCHAWGTSCMAFENDIAVGRDLLSCEAPGLTVPHGPGDCTDVSTESTRVIVSRPKVTPTTLTVPTWSGVTSWGSGFTLDNTELVVTGQLGGDAGFEYVFDVRNTPVANYGMQICAEIKATNLEGLHARTDRPAGLYGDVRFTDGTWVNVLLSHTNTGTHDWETVCLDFPVNGKTSDYMYLHGMIRDRTGEIRFKNLRMAQRDGNLVTNPTCQLLGDPANDGQRLFGFNSFGLGYTVGDDGNSGNCINLTSATDKEERGAEQILLFDPPVSAKGMYLGANFQAVGASGLSDRYSAVYADVFFADNTSMLGLNVPFPTSSAGKWKYQDAVQFFSADGTQDKKIVKINVLVTFVNKVGTLLVKDVELRLLTCFAGGPSGEAFGDPHYTTISGFQLDLQTLGEFVMYRDAEAELQVLHTPAANASIATGVGFVFHGSSVAITAAAGSNVPQVRVNRGLVQLNDGKAVAIPPSDNSTTTGVSVRRHGAAAGQETATGIPLKFVIDANSDVKPTESYRIGVEVFVSSYGTQYFTVALERSPVGVVATGLLTQTDPGLARRDEGAAHDNNAARNIVQDEYIHRVVGPQYAITDDAQSAFKHTNGVTSATLYDQPSAERYLNALKSIDPIALAAARNGPCAHLVEKPTLQEKCALDVTLSGDVSFANSYRSESEEPLGTKPKVTPPPSSEPEVSSASAFSTGVAVTAISLALVTLL
jgi:Domain of unknown function (DUF4114)